MIPSNLRVTTKIPHWILIHALSEGMEDITLKRWKRRHLGILSASCEDGRARGGNDAGRVQAEHVQVPEGLWGHGGRAGASRVHPLMKICFVSSHDCGKSQAQLRRRIIEKLAEQNRRVNDPEGVEAQAEADLEDKDSGGSNEDRMACGLVAEFLRERGFENTLAVFVPEIGGARNQLDPPAIVEVSFATGCSCWCLVLMQGLALFRCYTFLLNKDRDW